MDIASIKGVAIVDFLRRLGHKPVRCHGREQLFFAPYRNEKHPSLSVNTESNLYFDFGLGKGGDIFSLAGEIIRSDDFMAQIRFVADTLGGIIPLQSEPFKRESSFSRHKDSPFEDVEVMELRSLPLLIYIKEWGISPEVAKEYCDEVHYKLNGKQYYAIGFKTAAGGYELRNRFWKGCIAPKDISLIAGDSVCNLFEGFMDFLSAVQLGHQSENSAIVLNSVSNLHRAFRFLDRYSGIRCFLDNDDAGRLTLKTLAEKYPDRVQDCSSLYAGHKDVNEYLCSLSPSLSPDSTKGNKLKL